MATITKFYLHDAATGNSGTMPSGAFLSADLTGDATGARTARSADDTIGTGQTSSVITATANTNAQSWGHRRFVSAPLAARTFAAADGLWTWSWAHAESNLNHNMAPRLTISCWRPSTGARVGTGAQWAQVDGIEPSAAGTEQDQTNSSSTWSTSVTISDGDILVFEVADIFTQSMGVAYTSTFYYDGTTEGSATNNAAFVSSPVALTLFSAPATPRSKQQGGMAQAVHRAASRCWARRPSGIVVPKLWTPEGAVV